MPQARKPASSSTPNSMSTVGCRKAWNHRPMSSMGFGAADMKRKTKGDQVRQDGARLSMKACTPSWATGWAMLQAMVWPASW